MLTGIVCWFKMSEKLYQVCEQTVFQQHKSCDFCIPRKFLSSIFLFRPPFIPPFFTFSHRIFFVHRRWYNNFTRYHQRIRGNTWCSKFAWKWKRTTPTIESAGGNAIKILLGIISPTKSCVKICIHSGVWFFVCIRYTKFCVANTHKKSFNFV
jgi:hypothetical protein